jgi:hypothetical protein
MSGAITSLFSNCPAAGIAGGSASGTAIATLSHSTQLTQKGTYLVTVYAGIGAGVGANDAGNIVLSVGSSSFAVPNAPASGNYGPYDVEVSVDGNTDVVLKVGALSSVGVYYGTLTAKYLGPMGGRR